MIDGSQPGRGRRRPPAGSDPSILALRSEESLRPPRLIYYEAGELEEREGPGIAECAAYLARPGITWLDVVEPGRRDLAALQRLLQLHPLAVADAAHPPQRPKYATYADCDFFVLAGARTEGKIEQVSLFVGDRWLLTITETGDGLFEPVRERLFENIGPIRSRNAAFLGAALIAVLVESFFEPGELLREAVEDLEDEVLAGGRSPLFDALHRLRRTLLGMSQAVEPMREAIIRAVRAQLPRWEGDAQLHLREAGEDASQALEILETAQASAASLGVLYLSALSSRTNQVVTLLTLVSTLFLPMTFLTGVWGMNFQAMPELHWRWGYPLAWLTILASAAVQAWLFARRGWFRTLRGPWGSQASGHQGLLASRRRQRRHRATIFRSRRQAPAR